MLLVIDLFIAITYCLFIAIDNMLKWVCSVYQLMPKQELSTACLVTSCKKLHLFKKLKENDGVYVFTEC